MQKMILISLLVFLGISKASSFSYVPGNFSNGEPYLKAKVDTNSWLCITPAKFSEVLLTYSKKNSLDSEVILLNKELALYEKNEANYKGLLEILNKNENNYIQILKEYKTYADETSKLLAQEKVKKWIFGAVGINCGFLLGIITVILLP